MSQTKAQLLDGKSATIQFTGGSVSAPSVSFTGDTNTGIYSPGADQVAISTGGTRRLIVLSDGKVGLGAASVLQQGSGVDGGSGAGVLELYNGGTGNTTLENTGAFPILFKTNGSERLRITSAGLVGVGTSSPSYVAHITGAKNTTQAFIGITGLSSANDYAQLGFGTGSTNYGAMRLGFDNPAGVTNTYLSFFNDNGSGLQERLRIDSSGRVGIGTSSPGARLHSVETSAAEGLRVDGAAGGFSLVVEGGTTRVTRIRQATIGNSYVGNTPPTDGLLVQGSVGIGTTSPSGKLTVKTSTSNGSPTTWGDGQLVVSTGDTSTSLGIALSVNSADNTGSLTCLTPGTAWRAINYRASEHIFYRTDASVNESARIDSSGRLLVGTSSARANFFNSTLSSAIQVEGDNTNRRISVVGGAEGYPYVILGRQKGSTGQNVSVSSADGLGAITFQGNDGSEFVEAATIEAYVDGTPGANDMPGRIVLSTTAAGASSPTERMRITSGGTMLQGNTSDLTGVLGTGLKVKSNDVGTSYSAAALCLQGTGGDFYAIKFADSDMGVLSVTSGSVDYVQIGGSTSTATFYSNGLVQLPNVGTTASAANVFMDSTASNQLARSTSSLRYKTDIEDLDTDRADAALSLRPVWYRSKATADRKDWSHYGLIAEEVAEIEPRLVNWAYLEDDYITVTNEYGIENKELKPSAKLVPDGVQYARLPVLLLSIIQRQEKRIKQLEAEVVTIKAQLS